MEPPKNAKKVIMTLIDEILESSVNDSEERYDKAVKYSEKIVACGYNRLMKKYNIATVKELLHCDSVFSDYQEMFEKVTMVLNETDALRKLRKKHIKVDDLFDNPTDFFAPEANKEIRDEIEERLKVKIEHKTSKMYTCPRCGKNEAVVTEKQIARGDEPATVKVECILCSNKWVSKF
jgi:DNA-directed RNA polymerase subunit M/transcription elongation factor TFIIS